MSNHSTNGEPAGTNLLTGAIIVTSAFLLYGALALSLTAQAGQPAVATSPAAQQVIATAPGHVS
jgi:hypothetical protein